jgi:hypothetical protein
VQAAGLFSFETSLCCVFGSPAGWSYLRDFPFCNRNTRESAKFRRVAKKRRRSRAGGGFKPEMVSPQSAMTKAECALIAMMAAILAAGAFAVWVL